MEGESIEKIKHFSHPHSLVLNEDQSDKSKEARCSACLESLWGPSFSCGECEEFHLHKRCAQAPSEITHSPFHGMHPLTHTLGEWYCDLCNERRWMFFYRCLSCTVYLDFKCALLLHHIDDNFRELKYVAHQHPLTFIENPNDELKRSHCHWCQKPVIDSLYACLDCSFCLHKKCAQLPSQLNHPFHRKHPLYLEDNYLVCSLCQRQRQRLFYRCLPCKFDIDIECVRSMPWPRIEYSSHHEHPFTQLLRHHDPFVCDACGTKRNYVSYICSTCNIMIHEKCVSLPRAHHENHKASS